MVRTQTAVVPVGSLSMVARKTFRSCTGSALALAAAGAAVAGAACLAPPPDITYSSTPNPTAAATTKMPIQSRFDPDFLSPWVSSNIELLLLRASRTQEKDPALPGQKNQTPLATHGLSLIGFISRILLIPEADPLYR